MRLAGKRLTKDGVLVIVAQTHRTQERNRADALERLVALIQEAAVRPTLRRATKPTKASREKRLEGKKLRSSIKGMRRQKACAGLTCSVMPGLVPGIHVFARGPKTWMAGSSPAMTKGRAC